MCFAVFFFNDTATTEIYTLALHDALPICHHLGCGTAGLPRVGRCPRPDRGRGPGGCAHRQERADRKSTRLNSSHANISYAVFCLKKKRPPSIHFLSEIRIEHIWTPVPPIS